MPQSIKSLTESSHLTILISQMGGLGDLVLTAGLLASLRASCVDATLVLACRANVASVCELFPTPADQVIALDFNPYEWAIPSGELFAAVEPVLQQTASVRPDLFIASEFQPTWFTWLLAAHSKPAKAIQASLATRPDSVLTGTLEYFELERIDLEGPVLDTNFHEIQRYGQLVEYLGGATHASGPWVLPDAVETQVRTTLQHLNLRAGEYLTCFPLGAPGSAVKRWPKANYLQAIASVRRKHEIPVLFAGSESEASELHGFAEALSGEDVQVYAGSPDSIPILAGLLLHSRAYFGNDTGPMHLASAFSVSGVAIHGGGTWPAYGPWGPGSITMVHPLPCFGCNWDCLFGHGVCVESIRVEPVVEALDRLLTGKIKDPEVVLLAELSSQTNDLIRDANRRYREAQVDRRDRLSSIIELRRDAEHNHARLGKLEETAADRLRALEAEHAAMGQLRHESERRRDAMEQLTKLLHLKDVRIAELEETSTERLAALESQAVAYQELKQEADLRSAGLLELTEHVALRDRRIRELEEIAVGRFKALQTQSRAYEELRIEAERRTAGLIELTAHIATRDESIRELAQIAENRRQALEAQDVAHKELSIEADRRTAGLIDLTAHIAARDESIRGLTRTSEQLSAELAARDGQITFWTTTAEDRLVALQQADVAMRALSVEAEKRAAGLQEFSRIVADRDARIAEQRRVSEERLAALLTTDEALRAVRVDSELRLRGLEELTSAIFARNAQIEALEKTAAERLDALLITHAALQAERKRVKELEEKLTALNAESVYGFVSRHLKSR